MQKIVSFVKVIFHSICLNEKSCDDNPFKMPLLLMITIYKIIKKGLSIKYNNLVRIGDIESIKYNYA